MKFSWNTNSIPILQLGDDFYDEVIPAQFPQKNLRYWNDSINLPIEKESLWNFKPLNENLPCPLALRYHGHQFQHYNPQIGDGRGFLFAQFLVNNQWYDLGTKGSGQTPYSRSGDGRLTLKGAMREALATEMLESLGVTTSKTLCFYETGEHLDRGDEPSPTRSAVLTRFNLGHIRIGTFQRLAYFKQTENIKKLISYCLNFYYQNDVNSLNFTDDVLAAETFLKLVARRNAKLVAEVMMAGFVHGVLNTDNINISGELFDYGPYRFLPIYDSDFTAAYFDQQGLYSYGRQPQNFLWNLHQLGFSLQQAIPELNFEKVLESFGEDFNSSIQKQFLHRLNLISNDVADVANIVSSFFQFMDAKKLPFEQTFFDFHSLNEMRLKNSPLKSFYTGSEFEVLWKKLKTLNISDPSKINHLYFNQPNAETLLIDEVEFIWSAIDKDNDWSLFNNKLQSIRKLRGLY